MVSVILSRIVILFCGTLYPAYRSYKTVKTKNVREYVKWMMYWIVFAVFLCTEALLDFFVSFWFPFYYEAKILFVIWLLSPYTKGASFVYRKFIHPLLVRHEEDIDQYLNKAKTDSYSTLMRFGSKSILYAKEVVASAAIRGQEQLVNQLRKSYSLGDVSETAVDDDFADINRRRRETINALQGLNEGDNDEEVDERVWEGHYETGGKVVEKELMEFIDGADNAGRTQKAVSSVSKDDTATLRSATKSQTKKKDIEILTTTMSRRPIMRTAAAAAVTPTKKQ